jgi:hypothetical protein
MFEEADIASPSSSARSLTLRGSPGASSLSSPAQIPKSTFSHANTPTTQPVTLPEAKEDGRSERIWACPMKITINEGSSFRLGGVFERRPTRPFQLHSSSKMGVDDHRGIVHWHKWYVLSSYPKTQSNVLRSNGGVDICLWLPLDDPRPQLLARTSRGRTWTLRSRSVVLRDPPRPSLISNAGFAITPLVTASFSEEFGRLPLYIVTGFLFALFSLPIAL